MDQKVRLVRWELINGSFCARLIASKSRHSPINTMTIVRIELNGVVLSERLFECIKSECRFNIKETVLIVDSQIVRAMVQKQSYGFITYVAVRVGEIQEGTDLSSWYWIKGKSNVTDIISRGCNPQEISLHSKWQNGPEFLKLPRDEWPIK